FRTAIADVHGECTDRFLLRWLRAREFDVSKAEDMFRRDIEWRSKNGMSSILEDYQPDELLRRHFPGGLLECHSKGHPLFLVPIGSVDIRGFLQILPAAAMLRHLAYMLESGESLKERVSLKVSRRRPKPPA
ncbi:unnamed protein product, partial [Ixodes pacificus]